MHRRVKVKEERIKTIVVDKVHDKVCDKVDCFQISKRSKAVCFKNQDSVVGWEPLVSEGAKFEVGFGNLF